MNVELPDVQAGFRKVRGTRDHIVKTVELYKKQANSRKKFCFIEHAKAFDCVDHNKLWKILKEMGIPDHFTCLLRNLHAGQEATVRTGHGTTDWFKIEKGCSLLNFFTEYIMQNARLGEVQTGIKILGRNINNFRYAEDTTPYGTK